MGKIRFSSHHVLIHKAISSLTFILVSYIWIKFWEFDNRIIPLIWTYLYFFSIARTEANSCQDVILKKEALDFWVTIYLPLLSQQSASGEQHDICGSYQSDILLFTSPLPWKTVSKEFYTTAHPNVGACSLQTVRCTAVILGSDPSVHLPSLFKQWEGRWDRLTGCL